MTALEGRPPSQGTAALKQIQDYCSLKRMTVQSCSLHKTILTDLSALTPRPAMISTYQGAEPMGNVSKIVKQLRAERDKVEKQLSGLNAALAAFVGAYYGAEPKPTRKRRKISAAGRKRIAAAQRARWAKIKREKKKAA
jgi:hypothetical protein